MVLLRIRPVYSHSRHFLRNRGCQRHSRRFLSENGGPNGSSISSGAVESSGFSSRTMLALGIAGIGIAATLFMSNSSNKSDIPTSNTSVILEERVKRLEGLVSKLRITKNKAFVFIKPHAVTPEVEKLVLDKFEESKIKVLKTGTITGKEIDEGLLIDTHYGAIAAKAVVLSPQALTLTEKAKEDFKKLSNGMTWEEALGKGVVRNAKEYCEYKQLNGEQLDQKWSKLTRGKNLVKFGGGFYCGKLSEDEYVINGFYMAMRSKFTGDNDKIKYFLVEFLPNELKWSQFRGEILGGTDPAGAPKGSLRRSIYDNWKKLGLKFKPSTGENGVHASASPFEAFAERCNWLKDEYKVETDEFGEALLNNGVLQQTILEYMEDPAVEFEGKKQSLFDLVEDLDSEDCYEKLLKIAGL